MKAVALRNIQIGRGIPKVIVPIAAQGRGDILAMAERLKGMPLDAVEWRADFYEGIHNAEDILGTLGDIRSILGDIPIIFTCRTGIEGGMADMSDQEYIKLNKAAAHSGLADGIDIEVLSHGESMAGLVEEIQRIGCRVIGSRHMNRTPSRAEMTELFQSIGDSGGDIVKLAVHADSIAQALELMAAAAQAKKQGIGPLIPIVMGEQGVISRIAGELFGADAAFASVGSGSAQGQLSLEVMNMLLKKVHGEVMQQ